MREIKHIVVPRIEAPKPYEDTPFGRTQARQWLRNSGLDDLKREALLGRSERELLASVNLMRGCW